MLSLNLVIWGVCRTLDGLAFKPLISKASKLISFDGKESPGVIFFNGLLNGVESPVVCASLPLVVGYVAQYA